ncbi:MAG: choline dehydrogenase [Pseudomonadota bacterium]
MTGGADQSAIAGSADYVIVGSGSAGSVAASRLSEDGKHSVMVLEYGGTDMGPLIQMPAALSYPMNMGLYDWGFRSVPEKHLNNRQLATPRGKVIGGSSSINGMVYVRGHAKDYDHWNDAGATGWSYSDVLPYFQRAETSHGGEAGWRGTNGPLHVTRDDGKHPLFQAFIAAGEQAGFPVTADYNGSQQEGFGAFERTVYKGRRWSTANAYLKPALKRQNLSMMRCLARRILFDGNKAIGVEIQRGDRVERVMANREVVLAASSINTPKLLMISGVGPAEHLKSFGVDVVADRPGVGSNLQDHLELYIQQECTQPITLNSKLGLISKALIGAEWLFFKTGAGATNHFGATGFVRSKPGIDYPDIQFHFLPAAIRYDGKAPSEGHGFQAHVGPMRSKSRGTVRLSSSEVTAAPEIHFNYMSHEEDWQDFRHCIRLTREIFEQNAFDPFRGREISPGDHVVSDEALNAHIAEHAESAYHPCGTARLGRADDPQAVVDPECRVIGTQALRVIDTSIFPRITNGNLNGAAIMCAEKASDHILGRDPVPKSNLEPWINPRWQETDRV